MSVSGASAGTSDEYHVLVLDAGYKQSLACARSLGRTGLRVAMGESFVEFDPALPIPAFRSRYSAYNAVMPNYATDAAGYAAAVVDFVRKHATRVVLPTGDGSIAVLTPVREQLAELGCVLALAPDAALEIANDKDRTLEIARSLGIEQPKTVRFDKLEELPAVLAEFEFPFVLKPTSSWSAQSGNRFVPTEVIDEAEAETVSEMYLGAGFGVLAQQWACGRREGVTLFIVDGEVLASCAHVAHRTAPPLGGASVMRESIPLPADTYAAAVSLATAIGMQGVCEVEFRRDADFRPLLMEINARLAGTIENAVRSGVDFPLMIWQWASGLPVDRSTSYRTGVRTRWLHGDLRWLRENHGRAGRPDSVSRKRALWTFGSEFARTRYCDGFNWRDPGPGLAELRITAATVRKSLNAKLPQRTRVRKGMFTCGIVRCSSSVPVPTACQFLRICAGWG
jgi:predicted ATP-grasp superfamily ATP-dependent carboligase